MRFDELRGCGAIILRLNWTGKGSDDKLENSSIVMTEADANLRKYFNEYFRKLESDLLKPLFLEFRRRFRRLKSHRLVSPAR